MHGHDWGKFKLNWENDKCGKKIENPRRYGAFTPAFNSANEEFTREMSRRLAVSDLQPDDRVPWFIVYVGWTRTAEERRKQHSHHSDTSSAVGRLGPLPKVLRFY